VASPDGVLHADQVEKRKFNAILDFDQHVEIAVRSRVAARARAEDGKPRDAAFAQLILDAAKSRNYLVAADVGNYRHDNKYITFRR